MIHALRLGLLISVWGTWPSSGGNADDWFAFAPDEQIAEDSPLSLRHLNEAYAGEHGVITAKDGQFLHSQTGTPVRFWAVNGPPHELTGEPLRQCAKLLAHYGVNLVRVHGAVFHRETGELDPAQVRHIQEVVAAMKAEGIYTHLSTYFPLWFTPRADLAWLPGYDGQKHPFAALMFNPEFQAKHRAWLKALLTTPDAAGRKLVDDPAVFGVEIQNEDSFFFWTFDAKNLPEPQRRLLETQFGAWLVRKHGSLERTLKAWNNQRLTGDAPAEGRLAFRPLWNIANEKTPRDQDTAAFLLETQTGFYRSTYQFLRDLGFHGLIHGSNWATASPEVLGPLEKLSYTAGDFIDRHGYFECRHQGEHAAWSIRSEHTYSDRSALRFDPAEVGKPKLFVHPVMDPQYDDKPSMISETTFTRPNRYRSEAPLYFATYGALQATDAIVHFAFDGARWQVKPNFWMQQWTLCTPAMLGQFPAAALIYRQGLIQPGAVVADVHLNRDELRTLKGTPLPQDAAFDELRLKDVPQGTEVRPGQRLDPLLHYVGRARVTFGDEPAATQLGDLGRFIDHANQTVTSSTDEIRLDYRAGRLLLRAPQAQGASGELRSAGTIELPAMTIISDLDLGHIVAVSLDGQPLSTSRKILLQVMSEERATDFTTVPVDGETKRITNIGRDPWQVRRLQGTVALRRPDAAKLKVTPLDANGRPGKGGTHGARITLDPETLYYLVTP